MKLKTVAYFYTAFTFMFGSLIAAPSISLTGSLAQVSIEKSALFESLQPYIRGSQGAIAYSYSNISGHGASISRYDHPTLSFDTPLSIASALASSPSLSFFMNNDGVSALAYKNGTNIILSRYDPATGANGNPYSENVFLEPIDLKVKIVDSISDFSKAGRLGYTRSDGGLFLLLMNLSGSFPAAPALANGANFNNPGGVADFDFGISSDHYCLLAFIPTSSSRLSLALLDPSNMTISINQLPSTITANSIVGVVWNAASGGSSTGIVVYTDASAGNTLYYVEVSTTDYINLQLSSPNTLLNNLALDPTTSLPKVPFAFTNTNPTTKQSGVVTALSGTDLRTLPYNTQLFSTGGLSVTPVNDPVFDTSINGSSIGASAFLDQTGNSIAYTYPFSVNDVSVDAGPPANVDFGTDVIEQLHTTVNSSGEGGTFVLYFDTLLADYNIVFQPFLIQTSSTVSSGVHNASYKYSGLNVIRGIQ